MRLIQSPRARLPTNEMLWMRAVCDRLSEPVPTDITNPALTTSARKTFATMADRVAWIIRQREREPETEVSAQESLRIQRKLRRQATRPTTSQIAVTVAIPARFQVPPTSRALNESGRKTERIPWASHLRGKMLAKF
jgi:hypothetical protein